jgi:uncharacterized membrane protein
MTKTTWLFILLVAVATFTRCYKLSHVGLTKDEVITLALANGQDATVFGGIRFYADSTNWLTQVKGEDNLAGVVDATIHDNGNALLYNLTVHLVTERFGNQDVPFKATAAICGVLLVLCTFFFTKKHFGSNTALIATLLVALHPFLIEYSQLSRGYMMAALFTLCGTYLFFDLLSKKTEKKIFYLLYALCIVAALLCHYFTAFIFLGHGVVIILFHRNKKTLTAFAGAYFIAAVLFSLWLFNGGLKGQELMLEQNKRWENMAESAQNHQLSFTALGIKTVKHINALGGNKIDPLALSPYLSYLTSFAFIGFIFFFLRDRFTQKDKEMVILPLTFLLCIVGISFATGHTLAFDLRYATPVLALVNIITAITIVNAINKYKLIGFIAFICFICVEVVTSYPELIVNVQRKYVNPDLTYPKRAAYIEEIHSAGDTLLYPSVKDAVLTNVYFQQPILENQFVDSTNRKDHITLKNGVKNISIPLNSKRY